MIVDTSAIIAILEQEPEANFFEDRLLATSEKFMAAPSLLEACMVASGRRGPEGIGEVEELIRVLAVRILPFDERAARSAIDAFGRFGKGRHPAGLNFGDCISYALAKSEAMPLLFKGNDFRLTDIEPAI